VINQANQQAGVDNTVKVVHEDNETSPQAAVQAARKLVDSDNASCITGAWASSDTIPTAQSVSIPDGVLQISPASTSDEITSLNDDGLVNRTSPPDSFQGPTLANTMADAMGGANGKTVNIGARNDSYGTGLAQTFGDAWKALGGTVGQQVIYDPEQPSYDSEAAQITSGNPDAIVIIDFPETFAKVGPALQRTGNWDPSKGWFTDGLASGDVPESVDAQVIDGMRGTAPGSPDKGEASTAFDDLHEFGPEGCRSSDVRHPEFRRDDPLLPGRGRSWFDRRQGHGRQARRRERTARYSLHVGAAARGDQGAAERR
jgi:branched-chain amino acid transport system substrate-binding protein